jgi:hypothetical protein
VVPAGELQSPGRLIDSFQTLERREDTLRRHLEDILPDFIGRAREAGEILRGYG